MFYNHLFWETLAFLFCSVINITIFVDKTVTNKALRYSIGFIGLLGLIASNVRLIMLSIEYNWWWFVGGLGILLLIIGVFSKLFRSKLTIILGIINLLFIPFLWWYGSPFNTVLTADWF